MRMIDPGRASPGSDTSILSRLRLGLQSLITAHPSVQGWEERNRAQFLALLSLSTIFLSLLGALVGRNSFGIFLMLGGFSLLAYFLSRTRYYYIGTHFFVYALASIAFIRIYQGSTTSVDAAISTSVHISLVLASALLPQGSFIVFILLASIASFTTPLYSQVRTNINDSYVRTGGVVLVLGVILLLVKTFLALIDRAHSDGLQNQNRELGRIKTDLENQVMGKFDELKDAGRQMESRALRLQAISEISQVVASKADLELNELLPQIARLISEKTGFYHVGIFLLDQNNEYAVLRATNSAGGMKMLERRHQLKVGSSGIVGYVTQGGRARIARDTGSDAVFFSNPDLPETRSEMTLPLTVGAQVIGALDVQSSAPSAFSEDDVNALSTLANQLAVIIQNSQLKESGEVSAGRSQRIRGAAQLSRSSQTSGFTYLPDGTLSAATEIEKSIVKRALATGETVISNQLSASGVAYLSVPVKLRDQVIGIIHIEAADGKRKWTEDEISMIQAVSERAALAIENAGLFEASQRRVTQERVVSEVTSRIGESSDMERILQTTIQELGRSLGATRTFIKMGASPDNGND